MSGIDNFVNSFSQYLVAPLNAFGLGGFLFDIEGEDIHNLTTEITDHYLEDNTAIQDHIAVRPKKVTLKGYVGELIYEESGAGPSVLAQAVQKLTVLSGYLPELSQGALQVKQALDSSKINLLDNLTVNDAANYWGLVQNLSASSSKQQRAYTYFKSLMENKILVSVQTPFEFVTSMAIESITAIQPENTKFMSDFSIVLKQIRTVSELNFVNPNNSVTGIGGTNSLASATSNSYGPPDAYGPFQPPVLADRAAIQSPPALGAPLSVAQVVKNYGNMPGVKSDFNQVVSIMKSQGMQPVDLQ